jgi:hypothetical protein
VKSSIHYYHCKLDGELEPHLDYVIYLDDTLFIVKKVHVDLNVHILAHKHIDIGTYMYM